MFLRADPDEHDLSICLYHEQLEARPQEDPISATGELFSFEAIPTILCRER
jgi:hypothetical protein